jgi:hypothetical protein
MDLAEFGKLQYCRAFWTKKSLQTVPDKSAELRRLMGEVWKG